ncbi:hypothetical protein DSAG12_02075 [Promethearchaeum syntrophicum]|uniref:Uncharacterized protein n=1 Tax=Promethearchaeum syntrophicum TaxID=2594042 RepID=A0A5B9DB81_9ARCH|nr:hypothetical protein [Candidatus Prometheoarchaeum syntrophicum]QEE16245.1 hypothetical protein DSAG12_02075 [Candidatus Prometheoarchaeum syntrophicum]
MPKPDLSQFNFNELIDIVKTISRTKKKSSEGMWKNGYGLQSMDSLEANIDDVLDEIIYRVKEQWSRFEIERNFSNLALPHEILNLFNITTAELNKKLFKNPPTIGSEILDGKKDEIWFKIGTSKYIMRNNGNIEII